MPSPPSTHDIAHYLRTTPGLDKPQVGAVLGSGEDHELRRAFFAMFDYTGQPLLSSLRMVLQSFWLPGEGQQQHSPRSCTALSKAESLWGGRWERGRRGWLCSCRDACVDHLHSFLQTAFVINSDFLERKGKDV